LKKRVFISLILILTYTVGFAHNFIPHCTGIHADVSHSGLEHHHTHHTHHTHDGHDSTEENHSHVEHGDHFDQGLLDYLICLFEGAQHHGHSCDTQCTPLDSVFKYSSEKSTQGDQLISAELSILSLEIQSGAISTTTELDQTQIDLNSSSGRAPPYAYL
jgi:hypothetical protein